jgi:aryl-alcohol dehydrogenase-like predicted oxidoreductase
MASTWQKVKLGRTGLMCSPIGLGSSYGVGQADVERAFERGINYLYWGSNRRDPFGRAIAEISKKRREELVLVVQSYSRAGMLLRPSLERALRRAKTEYADVLLLGWWNDLPPRRIVDAALKIVESGKARHLMISCHHRPSFAKFAADPTYGAIMVRYNAAHPGAETDVFPHLGANPPGVVAYTATRWGQLVGTTIAKGEPPPRASDCYRFALSSPHVDVCLAGPRDGAELDEAMAALDRGPMSADEIAWMKRVGVAVHKSPVRSLPGPIELADRAARMLSRD